MVKAKVGKFTCNTSLGDQSITGIGFQPTAVIFLTISGSAAVNTDPTSHSFLGQMGLAAFNSVKESFMHGWRSNVSSSDVANFTVQASGTTGTLKTLDADGFTVTWGAVIPTSETICFLALGGDITNAKLLSFSKITTTGSQSVTGVGFKPDFCYLSLARATSTLTQGLATASNNYSVAQNRIAQLHGLLKNNKLLSDYNGNPAVVTNEATLTSFDADGLTLNWSTSTAASTSVRLFATKGGNYKLSSFVSPVSTGTQAITGLGFQPKAVLFFSSGMPQSSTPNTTGTNHMMRGFTDGTNQACSDNSENISTTSLTSILRDDSCIYFRMYDGSTFTTQQAATIQSMDSDGFTVNWGTSDGTQRDIGFIAFGTSGATPTSTDRAFFSFF